MLDSILSKYANLKKSSNLKPETLDVTNITNDVKILDYFSIFSNILDITKNCLRN